MAELLKNKKFWELFRFCFVGGIMTIINLLFLAFFVEWCHFNYLVGNVIAYMIAVVLSYFINLKFTFHEKLSSWKTEFLKLFSYCSMKLVMLGIDSCCLYLLVDLGKINLYVSKMILTVVLTVLSFSVSRMIMSHKNTK